MHLCNSCTKSVGQGDKRRTGNNGVHLLLNKVFLAKKGKLKSRFIETKNESLSRNYVQFCKSNLHSVASRVEVSTNSPCLTVTETDNEIRLSKSLFTSLTFCSVRSEFHFPFFSSSFTTTAAAFKGNYWHKRMAPKKKYEQYIEL